MVVELATDAASPADEASPPLLEVRGLAVDFARRGRRVPAVLDVSLRVDAGESVAIVGESGSGKSVTTQAVLGLVGFRGGRVSAGSVRFDGRELTGLPEKAWKGIRGNEIGLVLQDALSSFNPIRPIGDQIAEAMLVHRVCTRAEVRDRVVSLLAEVGIRSPDQRYDQLPHEFSGGMLQRALIAMALAPEPRLLVADEPTTALDVTVQAQIIGLLRRLAEERSLSVLLVTHDLPLATQLCDRIVVMYAGRVVEDAATDALLRAPAMPYSRALVESAPSLDVRRRRLVAIPGAPTSAERAPSGCPFHPRCPLSDGDRCATEVPLLRSVLTANRLAACHYAEAVPDSALVVDDPPPAEPSAARPPSPLLELVDVEKRFVTTVGPLRGSVTRAVDKVTFEVGLGESVALVGESGSGKTTTIRCAARLQAPSAGTVRFEGRDVSTLGRRQLLAMRRHVQVVFQDPAAALDPRRTVRSLLSEPLRIHGRWRSSGGDRLLTSWLERVGLGASALDRRPTAFSGGERQRIAIARALVIEPRLLILDEPVSSLDVSIRAGVLNLLADLQREHGYAYLLITHDLSVVRFLCSRVLVMREGSVVEQGETDQVLGAPQHPYTRSLVDAVPRLLRAAPGSPAALHVTAADGK